MNRSRLLCGVFLSMTAVLSAAQREPVVINVDAPAPRNLTLVGMSDRAAIIVEASVQSFFPEAAPLLSSLVERDALLQVTRVLKGPSDVTQIVVSEATDARCSGCPLEVLQLGHRYILFLQAVSPNRIAVLPKRDGIARYGVYLINLGLFRVDGDRLHLSPDFPAEFRAKYQGSDAAAFLLEITEHFKKP